MQPINSCNTNDIRPALPGNSAQSAFVNRPRLQKSLPPAKVVSVTPYACGTAEFKIYQFLRRAISKPAPKIQLQLRRAADSHGSTSFNMCPRELWRFLATYCGHTFGIQNDQLEDVLATLHQNATLKTQSHASFPTAVKLQSATKEMLPSATELNNGIRQTEKAKRVADRTVVENPGPSKMNKTQKEEMNLHQVISTFIQQGVQPL